MVTLKELSRKEELFAPGHRLCAGCGAGTVIRQVLLAVEQPVVIGNATGCLEVATSIFPYTAWRVNWFHSAFENAAATVSGIEAMYRSLKRQGKIPKDKDIRFIAIGGDGGTYDIGIQSLSGAMERGHRMLYICYDNGAYMNTGIQRSSSTPIWADTTTCPAGSVVPGKKQIRKNLTDIMIAHNIPYVAQASPSHWKDLVTKVRNALDTDGPSFINILSPCHRGWRAPVDSTIWLSKLAVDTCFWPLYEVVEGRTKITYKPKEKLPITEFIKHQGRFKHLFKPGKEHLIQELQCNVDWEWEKIIRREKMDETLQPTCTMPVIMPYMGDK